MSQIPGNSPLDQSPGPGTPLTLEHLRDIQLPPEVSIWPLPPGYYIVLAGLVIIALTLFFTLRWRRRNFWRKQARLSLVRMQQHYYSNKDKQALAESLNTLLKSVVQQRRSFLTAGETQGSAGLSGTAWVKYLATLQPVHCREAALSPLAEAPYQASPEYDAEALVAAVQEWVQRCP